MDYVTVQVIVVGGTPPTSSLGPACTKRVVRRPLGSLTGVTAHVCIRRTSCADIHDEGDLPDGCLCGTSPRVHGAAMARCLPQRP